jgi:hypothetical protein
MDKTNETLAERIGDKQPQRRRTLAELDFGQFLKWRMRGKPRNMG